MISYVPWNAAWFRVSISCEHVGDLQALGIEDPLRQGIEHEGIVRVGAVGDADVVVVVCVVMAPEGIRIKDAGASSRLEDDLREIPRAQNEQVFINQRFVLMARPLY